MKDSTQKLLDQIDKAHDWAEGQVFGGSGTQLSSTDNCRVCMLRRHYHSDTQNGIEGEYRFSDGETNEDLSVRQAVARGCLSE
jgi:hypothetical protein